MRRALTTITFALVALTSLPAAAAEKTEPAAKEASPQLILPRGEARGPAALPSWAYDPPKPKPPLVLPAP